MPKTELSDAREGNIERAVEKGGIGHRKESQSFGTQRTGFVRDTPESGPMGGGARGGETR